MLRASVHFLLFEIALNKTHLQHQTTSERLKTYKIFIEGRDYVRITARKEN